jgi:hypothetical protein
MYWVDRIEGMSELYCGTVARSIEYLKNPIDVTFYIDEFRQGLARIFDLYRFNPSQTPILSKMEAKWLLSELSEMWKSDGIWQHRGRKGFVKNTKALLLMKKASDRGISYASLLADAKAKKRILNAEEKRQSIAFIQSNSNVSDPLCQELHKDLLKSIENRSFIIPDENSGNFNFEQDIRAAINKGIEYFSEKMVHRDITVTGYYAYAQISRYLINPTADFEPVAVSIKVFWSKLKANFETEDKATVALLKDAIIAIIGILPSVSTSHIDHLMKYLGLSEIFKNFIARGGNIPEYNFENPKYSILEVISADLLGRKTQKMKLVYDTITTDPDLQMLCPDMKLVADRLKKFVGTRNSRNVKGDINPV